jgi:hypothetical protein
VRLQLHHRQGGVTRLLAEAQGWGVLGDYVEQAVHRPAGEFILNELRLVRNLPPGFLPAGVVPSEVMVVVVYVGKQESGQVRTRSFRPYKPTGEAYLLTLRP